MSNRRKSTLVRKAQAVRNAPRHGGMNITILHKRDGELARNEGNRNYPYGPRPGAKSGLNAIYKSMGRTRKQYPDHSRDDAKRATLEAMSRDDLRGICKAQNVSGYGKMNKAGLVEAALA